MIHQEIQELLFKKQFGEASDKIHASLEQDPDSADHHYLLGVLHYMEGRIGPTIQELKKALSLDPRHTDAAICLSVLYNDMGKYQEARSVFELANHSVHQKQMGADLGVDRKFAIKHLELADLYVRYRRYDEAVEQYTQALSLDPTSIEIRIRRAKAFAKKGFVTRAQQELIQIKNQEPRAVEPRVQLGLLYFSQGNLIDAELEWESVLQEVPSHPEASEYLKMSRSQRTI
jgi:tetratricopeptide (TPR) repeat protein